MLTFMCPTCCASISVTPEKAGQSVICPECGHRSKAPHEAGDLDQTAPGESGAGRLEKTILGEVISSGSDKALPGAALPPPSLLNQTVLGEVIPEKARLGAPPPPSLLNQTVLGEPLHASALNRTILGDAIPAPSLVQFACPTCRKFLQCPPQNVSQRMQCPGCGQVLTIPAQRDQTVVCAALAAPLDKTILGQAVPPPPGSLNRTVLGEPVCPSSSELKQTMPSGVPIASMNRTVLGQALPATGLHRTVLGDALAPPMNPVDARESTPIVPAPGGNIRALVLVSAGFFLITFVGLGAVAAVLMFQAWQRPNETRDSDVARRPTAPQQHGPSIPAANDVAARFEAEQRREKEQERLAQEAERRAGEAREREARAAAERERLRRAAEEKERQRRLAEEVQRRRQEEERARREAEMARARREQTNQLLVPVDKDLAVPAEAPAWADACDFDVRQGDVQIHLAGARRTGDAIAIQLTVQNLGKQPLTFQPWSAASGDSTPRLLVEEGTAAPPKQRNSEAVVIVPSGSAGDTILFQSKPPDSTLKLELPGACISGEGKLRLLIPKMLLDLEAAPSLGEKGLPLLRELLFDKRARLRVRAVAALGTLGELGVRDLARTLGDANPEVRMTAVTALGKIGPKAAGATSEILAAIQDPNPRVRVAAITIIPRVELWSFAVRPLLAALKDPDETVALVAGKVLKDSGKLTRDHVPALVDALKNGPAESRELPLRMLVEFAPKSVEARAAIVGALDEPTLRMEAMQAVADLGPAASLAVPKLLKLLSDTDKKIKRQAMTSLGKIGPKAGAAAPALIALLTDEDWHGDAVSTLVMIGEGAVADILEKLENTKNFKSRVELIAMLGDIGPPARSAISPLTAIVNGEELPGVRKAAARALAKIDKRKN